MHKLKITLKYVLFLKSKSNYARLNESIRKIDITVDDRLSRLSHSGFQKREKLIAKDEPDVTGSEMFQAALSSFSYIPMPHPSTEERNFLQGLRDQGNFSYRPTPRCFALIFLIHAWHISNTGGRRRYGGAARWGQVNTSIRLWSLVPLYQISSSNFTSFPGSCRKS